MPYKQYVEHIYEFPIMHAAFNISSHKKIFKGNNNLIEKVPQAVIASFVKQVHLSITCYDDNAWVHLTL